MGKMSAPPVGTERPAPGDEIGRAGLAVQALKRLAAAFRAARLYHSEAATSEAVRHFLQLHARYAERFGPLTIEVARSSFILDFEGTERTHDLITPLAQSLHARWIRQLSVLPGVLPGEIQHLLDALTAPRATVRLAGGVGHLLRERGATRIALDETAAPDESPPIPAQSFGRRAHASVILRLFVAASKNIHLYPSGHPIVETSIEELRAAITRALAHGGSIRYDVRDGAVFHERELLDMDALFVEEFAAECAARRMRSLTFRQGVTREELAHAASLFAREPETLIVEGGFSEALRTRRVTHVSAGPIEAA